MNLKDLAANHPYYASESNYYSNEAAKTWVTMADFVTEYKDADIDMNLIYRWDIYKRDDVESYYAMVFIIHQRKGIYAPQIISNVFEQDIEEFVNLVKRHWSVLVKLWIPISEVEE